MVSTAKPTTVWRITREAFQALDGEGARLNGGRWNPVGIPAVYTSSTLSLAALEYLIQIDPENVPADLVSIEIEIPDSHPVKQIQLSELPENWNRILNHPTCVEHGEEWARARETLTLHVPSAIIPAESNVIINPKHAAAQQIKVKAVSPFSFDPRLIR